ncbi:peptide ABC transporter permease [Gardnerella vaginalis]|jgi:oligopeptide ABC superfamily ATP binding cassette transporter, membrane protein|uniref:Oligopeptide transport system permease protein OppC n=2 Tax=Gardnerella vaginalis TaxID=2702 RepID=A0AAP8P443_GARVA|nr:ABC transporter permease [Gardnerella vaginalis]CQB86473.1 putative peptide ABC transport system permease protein [Chlamydia trachomatis]ADP38371.1 ABC transporter, permease protein [Gardnerella vaginalis ATCC 14019]AEF30897.1 ABC transporter, permease protein [Gardnerella vaginalis HMP9231]AYZ21399.1 ABC transporter permease [Gardnerella vaginalis]EGL13455.1 ABC transporter, permease protein [Gardnerella vaginalis 315-A]
MSKKDVSSKSQESVADKKANANSWGNFKRTGKITLYTRRFFRRPSAVVGLVLLVFLILLALFGSKISKWGYDEPDFTALATPPSAEHWLGTTPGGSDMYAMVVRGLGRSLSIGIVSSISITIIAALVGTAISYFEGWFEQVGMWVLDMLLIVPSFLLIALIVSSATGGNDWLWLAFGMTSFGWIGYARTLRTLTLSLREREYVRAAKFEGVSSFRIIVRHLVPNLGSVLIINTVLGVIGAINGETALSFLGLGIKAPDTSLGTLLNVGQSSVMTSPWVLLVPSAVLVILTFSVQLIGDGLRDAIDPYSRSVGKAE